MSRSGIGIHCGPRELPAPTGAGSADGVIFGNDLLYVHLCALIPDAMLEFFRGHRVMVIRQTTIPSRMATALSGMTLDAVLFPWKKLARRIAIDLGKFKGAISSGPVFLEAEWRPQLPAEDVLQTAFLE